MLNLVVRGLSYTETGSADWEDKLKADISSVSPSSERLDSLWQRANALNISFQSLYGSQFTLSTQLINPKFCVSLPHRRSTTVSVETNPFVCFLTEKIKNDGDE